MAVFLAAGVSTARASERVDANAVGPRLAVNARSVAMVTYRAPGRTFHTLVWGAVHALPPPGDRRSTALRRSRALLHVRGAHDLRTHGVPLRRRRSPYPRSGRPGVVAGVEDPRLYPWPTPDDEEYRIGGEATHRNPLSQGFHVYAIRWLPDAIQFKLDGRPYGSIGARRPDC
jgi:hypothetical protein